MPSYITWVDHLQPNLTINTIPAIEAHCAIATHAQLYHMVDPLLLNLTIYIMPAIVAHCAIFAHTQLYRVGRPYTTQSNHLYNASYSSTMCHSFTCPVISHG